MINETTKHGARLLPRKTVWAYCMKGKKGDWGDWILPKAELPFTPFSIDCQVRNRMKHWVLTRGGRVASKPKDGISQNIGKCYRLRP